jgi:hypothetical protein
MVEVDCKHINCTNCNSLYYQQNMWSDVSAMQGGYKMFMFNFQVDILGGEKRRASVQARNTNESVRP